GIDQSAAIVVHGDSFFVTGGQVAIHDGKQHDGTPYYFLSTGQSFNLRTRSVEPDEEPPFSLTVVTASRSRTSYGIRTLGTAVLDSRDGQQSRRINYDCGVSLYSAGKNIYQTVPVALP